MASAVPGSRMGGYGAPPMTSTGQRAGETGRPMTSISGTGFRSSNPNPESFDFVGSGVQRGPAPPLAEIADNGPEAKAKVMEKLVNKLLEESAAASIESDNNDYSLAYEKADAAVKKERQLCKHREMHNLMDQINLDLTYAVCFNMALVHEKREMYSEAINTYGIIVKNKQYSNSGRLRVNIGNLYFKQKQFLQAVRMYRIALDQLQDNQNKDLRLKIQTNIGKALIRAGQYREASEAFAEVLSSGHEDLSAAFNLVVCRYAIGKVEDMQAAFKQMLNIPVEDPVDDDDDDDEHAQVEKRKDPLTKYLLKKRARAMKMIQTASQLLAPIISKENWEEGYDWVIANLQQRYPNISSEIEIQKAVTYLKVKRFKEAITMLKAFEKRDRKLMAKAATNLSFLYFLDGPDTKSAVKYADMAVKNQRYNAKALVNKGNCCFALNDLERAKEVYLEAIGVESDCIEAIYNLGLVNKQMGTLKESLQAFEKLHSIVPKSPTVIYNIAHLHEMMGNFRAAAKWFNILITRVPTDPGILYRLGQICGKDEDETNAFHYHLESHKFYPVNLDVISWLGVWFVKNQIYEKAISFFEQATRVQPDEVKWKLMVTSCYRRMGNYQKALELYQDIHKQYPQNLECLRYLVAICKDLGTKHVEYQRELTRLERVNMQHTMVAGGGRTFAQFGGEQPAAPAPARRGAPQVEAPAANFQNFPAGGGGGEPQQQQRQQQQQQQPPQRQPQQQPPPAAKAPQGPAEDVDSADDWAISDEEELPGFNDD